MAVSLGLAVASVPIVQYATPPVAIAEVSLDEIEERRPVAVLAIDRPGLRFELTPSTSSMMRLDPASTRLSVEASVTAAAGFPFPFAERTWSAGASASGPTRVVHLGWTVAGETIGASVPARWMPRDVNWLRLVASVAVTSAMLLLLRSGACLLRAAARLRRERCVWCGYDRRGLAACPECGP